MEAYNTDYSSQTYFALPLPKIPQQLDDDIPLVDRKKSTDSPIKEEGIDASFPDLQFSNDYL